MIQTLHDLLNSGEWTHAEFKAARSALPKSVFESVSAFANTRGGWIVLGATQDGERFEVSGVAEPEEAYLAPALTAALIEMTIPDKPNSRLQKYRLTDKGQVLAMKESGR